MKPSAASPISTPSTVAVISGTAGLPSPNRSASVPDFADGAEAGGSGGLLGGVESLGEVMGWRGEAAPSARVRTEVLLFGPIAGIMPDSPEPGRPAGFEETDAPMIEALNSDDLIRKFGGRFKLTALIQRRLEELIAGDRPLVERRGRSDLEVVVDEILQDKISLTSGES